MCVYVSINKPKLIKFVFLSVSESDVEPENAVTPVGKEKFLLVKLFEPFKEEIETKYRQCCCFCVTGCTPNCT